jgi:FkbM family methyltransferase
MNGDIKSILKELLPQPVLDALRYPLLKLKQWAAIDTASALDNLAALLVSDPVIRVEEFNGIFRVDPRSDLFRRLIVEGVYEPTLVHAFVRYLDPRKDFIDVGANVGFYTVLLAQLLPGAKVLAIEPTNKAYERLEDNVRMNHVQGNVILFKGVASDAVGTREIKVVPGREEYSSLGKMCHPKVSHAEYVVEPVVSSTIDELVDTYSLNPGLLKVDVEGCEHHVFQGAKATLSSKRPVVLSELSDTMLRQNGSSSQEIVSFITSLNYKIYDPLAPKLLPGARDFGDIICVPAEAVILP